MPVGRHAKSDDHTADADHEGEDERHVPLGRRSGRRRGPPGQRVTVTVTVVWGLGIPAHVDAGSNVAVWSRPSMVNCRPRSQWSPREK